jgi:hypothetical protein
MNAKVKKIAEALEAGRKGTFTGLVVRKRGVTRGRGEHKVVYGDDLVHVLVVTGFRYRSLCERSLDELATLDLVSLANAKVASGLTGFVGRGKKAVEVPVTLADFEVARDELVDSLSRSRDGENKATHSHAFEPLVVEGVRVRGGRVYSCCKNDPDHECHCRECTGDPRAPLAGTIYLQGLKIGESLVESAEKPIPPTRSSAKTVAKNVLKKLLPVSRYVSYSLEPGSEFRLAVGGAAVVEASDLEIDEQAVESVA